MTALALSAQADVLAACALVAFTVLAMVTGSEPRR